jgi:hypothetical protein
MGQRKDKEPRVACQPAARAPQEGIEALAVWLRWSVVESVADGRAEIVRVPDDAAIRAIKSSSPGDYGVVEHHPEGGHSFHGPMSLDEARDPCPAQGRAGRLRRAGVEMS